MKTKTTIELPEELFVAAKRQAAERRTTLRTLIERGLRTELQPRPTRKAKPARIKWVVVEGGLPGPIDVGDRAAMIDALRRRS
jgi:hypothetical protein